MSDHHIKWFIRSGHVWGTFTCTAGEGVADWLDAEAKQARVDEMVWRTALDPGWARRFGYPLAVAAVVLDRPWLLR